jgi:[ribosomal protein S5]-alanine N-acetyltransferase
MSISIIRLDLRQIRSPHVDASHLDGMPVAVGTLPPPFIPERAIRAFQEGAPPVWCAPFAFIENRLNEVVGAALFKGPPAGGRVEIGYGVAEQHRGRGFAGAGVRQLLQVAFAEAGVVEVYAQTAIDNPSSRRVVEKTGFRHVGQRMTTDDGTVDRWLRTVSGESAEGRLRHASSAA